MKRLIIITAFFLGCGAADKGSVDSPAAPPEPDAETHTEATAADEVTTDDLVGAEWQNASCGERKYLRRITFNNDGTFIATDEVAPCPAGETCVSSGIVEWQGSWSLNAMIIEISLKPEAGGKLPEQVPDNFVVLTASPFSLGEQIGQLVCPYRGAE